MELSIINNEIPKPQIPDDWNFERASKQFDKLIFGWRRMTVDVVSELWVFYCKLKRAKGRKSENSEFILPSWLEWIESKGIDPDTALNHFRKLEWLSSKTLVQKHTGNQENYTPPKVIESVREVFGKIDLDPASCEYAQRTIQADNYFTENDDGLDQKWYGNVFLNPPYQYPAIEEFTVKLIEELNNIESAILLTNNNTDTVWFHNCASFAKAICFTKGRINFYTTEIDKTQPTNGQTFFYFGNDVNKFISVFKNHGIIMKVIQ